jgi:F-type H+-transporting ATPase subunit alpha
LNQPQFDPIPVGEQIALIYAGTNGLLDPLEPTDIAAFVVFARDDLKTSNQKLVDELATAKDLDEKLEGKLKDALEKTIKAFKKA